MKKAKDQVTIRTIPDGAYESGVDSQDLQKENNNPHLTLTTDAQGNGYPVNHQNMEKGD